MRSGRVAWIPSDLMPSDKVRPATLSLCHPGPCSRPRRMPNPSSRSGLASKPRDCQLNTYMRMGLCGTLLVGPMATQWPSRPVCHAPHAAVPPMCWDAPSFRTRARRARVEICRQDAKRIAFAQGMELARLCLADSLAGTPRKDLQGDVRTGLLR